MIVWVVVGPPTDGGWVEKRRVLGSSPSADKTWKVPKQLYSTAEVPMSKVSNTQMVI